jgi:tripartite-type tricarboxylate transporter receptor subunit TctC
MVLPALAQTKYPEKAVTFVVPFAAGSATDQLARALGSSITHDTKQAVIVDNKAGASGMLAAQAVARAPADGYTVLITTNTTHAANEHLYKKLSYDPVKDFVPVTGLGKGGQVLVVRTDAPYKSVGDLVSKAKQEPGKLSFGSGSSSSRVAGEMFKQLSGTNILHVPYKSNPQAITDLLGGQIDFMITDTATGVPQIKGGKLRALGASTTKRNPLLPEVPTPRDLDRDDLRCLQVDVASPRAARPASRRAGCAIDIADRASQQLRNIGPEAQQTARVGELRRNADRYQLAVHRESSDLAELGEGPEVDADEDHVGCARCDAIKGRGHVIGTRRRKGLEAHPQPAGGTVARIRVACSRRWSCPYRIPQHRHPLRGRRGPLEHLQDLTQQFGRSP